MPDEIGDRLMSSSARLYCGVCRRQRFVFLSDTGNPYVSGWVCGVCGAPILCEQCGEMWSQAHQDASSHA